MQSDLEDLRQTIAAFRYPDFGVIANLLKLAALAAESRDQLHEAAYLRTQDSLFGLLFSLVFED